jgi:threonylcarbamoyladenosine tRNA methylthiotransferase MtaB
MIVAIHTLGCKVNQCDADELIAALKADGHTAFSARSFDIFADIFVVNTCTVTHTSDKKSRQMLRRAKNKNPNALVAMCGCMAKKSDKIDGVDFIFDAREPREFLAKVNALGKKTSLPPQEIPKTKTRSFIKIQDGCDRFCSYRIVPHVRGAVKSRPLSEIIREAEILVNSGALEIVLTGIQVAAYGNDTEKENLSSVVKNVAAIDGLKRLRLSSIDPWAVNAEFIAAIAETPVLCGHFHLSLQSGCDTTLEKMNRRYTTDDYRKAAASLRKIRPNAALTTDVIVGFPSESDSDFLRSLDFVREMEFSQVHVFEFSPREGTPAANFPAQVPQNVKHERGKIMREAVAELQKNFLERQVGRTLSVLFERENGKTENYCTVRAKSATPNKIYDVKITSCTDEFLEGEIQE